MAVINIQFSQSVVNQQHTSALNTPVLNGTLGSLIDALSTTGYTVAKNYPYYTSWSLTGSTLRFNFVDGATETYTGVVLANPGADHGTATATGFEFYKNGLLTESQTGAMNFDYALTPSANGYDLAFHENAGGFAVSALRLTTLLPSYSADPVTGNVSIVVNGAVTTNLAGERSGSISKLTATADKYVLSSVIDGDFQIAANALTVGQGLSHTAVSGILTGYKDDYRDGSHAYVSGVSTFIGTTQLLNETMFSDATRFPGSDDITISLPAQIYTDFLMASGGGDDHLTISGGGGRLGVASGAGNDRIAILGDAHYIDGGADLDTVVLAGTRASYKVEKVGPGFGLTDHAGAVSMLVNVERISFADATIALDIDGHAGQAYRLYQAAFNRAPDAVGLGYWISAMDKGASLSSIASGFVTSSEFRSAYGVAPTNHDLVTQFYQNILHRAPEDAGLAYWSGILDSKAGGTADVLAAISESAENQLGVIGVIGNGFAFVPYG